MKTGEIATKQDVHELKEALCQEIRQLANQRLGGCFADKKWLTTREVRKYVDLSTSSLHNLRAKGVLNPRKLGGTLFYSRAEIDSAIDSGDLE